jgi:acyl carrier protein
MERSEVERRVLDLLVAQLGVERGAVDPESLLEEDLGLDSLGMVELFLALEEACGVVFPDEEAGRITTVRAAVDAVMRLGG